MEALTRRRWLCWYLPLVAGLTPVLLLGLATSVLADRLVFAAWAVAVAAAHAALLRLTYDAGWEAHLVGGADLLTLGLGFVAFAALVERHQEVLDLGFRAFLPLLYHPNLTRPAAPLLLALLLAAAGAGELARGGRRHRGAASGRVA
jgi:hypothetical protein